MSHDDSSERLQLQIDELSRRLDVAQARADDDRDMIVDLQAQGVVSDRHTRDLEAALKSSRTIGKAIGILMESRKVSEDEALEILKQASQDHNRKLRDIAAELVRASAPREAAGGQSNGGKASPASNGGGPVLRDEDGTGAPRPGGAT